MTGDRCGAIARRILPCILLLALLLGVAALWIGGAHDAYFALFRLLGVPAYRLPFLDTHGVLAVIACHARGIDVYLTNPCDVMGRVHVYTPLWFRLDGLPIDPGWTPQAVPSGLRLGPYGVGFALALIFAASLLLLPPGRSARAASISALAALSPATAFALERGNADLLMFALAALAAGLALRHLPTRLLAFPIVLLATALKIYPATLLVLALRERWRLCLVITVVSLAVLAAYAAIDATGLREMLAVVPGGTPFIYSFGARNLPTGLAIVLGWPPILSTPLLALLFATTVLFALRRLPALRLAISVLTPAEATALTIGAVLILGCFVTGQSGEYRAIHLLFALPALTTLAQVPGPARRLAGATTLVILLQLWGDIASAPLSHLLGTPAGAVAALLVWLARELLWWWIAAVLLSLLAAIAFELPAVADLRVPPGGRR